MSILPIYNCFHPVLKQKTKPVTKFDQELKDFIDNMFETMEVADGIGLAANQVGDSRSIMLIDTSKSSDSDETDKPFIMINPKITAYSDEIIDFQEGCLSIPKFYEDVLRPEAIEIEYTDADMKEHKIEIGGLPARVMLHEFDHLNGILFYERLTTVRKTLARKKLKKIKKGDYSIPYDMILPDGTFKEKEV